MAQERCEALRGEWLDRYWNSLANPQIEGLLVLKAIRTFEVAT